MVFIEAISRLRGNILGNQESAEQDTFSQMEFLVPQYTRPSNLEGSVSQKVFHTYAQILSGAVSKLGNDLQRRPELLTKNTKAKMPDLMKVVEQTQAATIYLPFE